MLNYLKSFFRKKESEEPEVYIKFWIEDQSIKIEFAYENILDLIAISDQVLNAKIRQDALHIMYNSMIDGGMNSDASSFISHLNRSIKPSEVQI